MYNNNNNVTAGFWWLQGWFVHTTLRMYNSTAFSVSQYWHWHLWHYTFCLPRDSQLLMKGKSREEDFTKMGHWGCAKSERFLWKHTDWANTVTLLDFSPICIQTTQRSRGCFCNTTQLSINIWNWMKHMSSLYLRIFFHRICCHLASSLSPKNFFGGDCKALCNFWERR